MGNRKVIKLQILLILSVFILNSTLFSYPANSRRVLRQKKPDLSHVGKVYQPAEVVETTEIVEAESDYDAKAIVVANIKSLMQQEANLEAQLNILKSKTSETSSDTSYEEINIQSDNIKTLNGDIITEEEKLAKAQKNFDFYTAELKEDSSFMKSHESAKKKKNMASAAQWVAIAGAGFATFKTAQAFTANKKTCAKAKFYSVPKNKAKCDAKNLGPEKKK